MMQTNDDHRLFAAVFAILSVFVFFPLLKTGFTTSDDIQTALIAWNIHESMGYPLWLAENQGRFVKALNIYLEWVPYVFHNAALYQVFRLGPVLMNCLLFFMVVRWFVGSSLFACFSTILLVGFLQNNWQHSLVTSYPFAYQIGFSCFLLSLFTFLNFSQTQKKVWAMLTGLLYLLSMISTETFASYFVVFVFLAVCFDTKAFITKSSLKKTVKLLSPVVVVTLLYVCCYVAFRMIYPSNYGGIQVAEFSLGKILRVIGQLSIGTFPGALYLTYSTINSTFDGFAYHRVGIMPLIENLKADWIVKGMVMSGFCWLLLRKKRIVFNFRSFIVTLALGILFIILPFFLIGLTPKYQTWVGLGVLSYLPSFYSFFGTILFISTIILYCNQLLAKKAFAGPVYALLTAVLLFAGSLVTDYYNYYVARDQQLSQLKWTAMDHFLKSREFNLLPETSVIYAPSLWQKRGIISYGKSYWTDYVRQKTGKQLTVIKKYKKLLRLASNNTSLSFYFLSFIQEPKAANQFMVFASLDNVETLSAKNVVLFSLSKYKDFILIGGLKTNGEQVIIDINGQRVKPENIGTSMFCQQVSIPNPLGPLTSEELKGKSFFEMTSIALNRIFMQSADSEDHSVGFFRTRIHSNVFIYLEAIILSFFPVQMDFGILNSPAIDHAP